MVTRLATVMRWLSETSEVSGWLDETHRTPRLVLAWPSVDGWSDEGSYAFEQVLDPYSHARRVIVEYLGATPAQAIAEAVAAVRRRPGERADMDTRTWSRTVSHGFCSGDLDDVDWVVAGVREVQGAGYTHSYGDRSDESSWAAPLGEFMNSRCVCRHHCASFLTRIDAYIRL